MDFRRIEWIFLIVFIGLNIFLGYSLFQNQQVDLATSRSDNSEIVRDIKGDQIKLPKLSTKLPTGGYLASQPQTDALKNGAANLREQTTQVTSGTDATLHSTIRSSVRVKKGHEVSFMTKWKNDAQHVFKGKHYVYAPELSAGNTYVFAQKDGGRLLYDSRAALTFTVVDGELSRYTQTYVPNLKLLRGNVALCSEQDAIVTLYRDNELPANSKILWTRLAYSYLLNAKGSTMYVPTWQVGVESQSAKTVTVKKLNAINKTVEKNAAND